MTLDRDVRLDVRRLTNPGAGRRLRIPFNSRLLAKHGSRHQDA